ncbi:hypothetical protein H6P81_008332 [Aristolochia fimbriata]|uniref:Uncharacterized protein n=1 Tax=Aristolochia fimbriata TaxID=158543 RepID=A0AAV7F325_ARIFI|nr:hypothetical protein H6P81_008332 [Aristolochia fimbriata]
MEGVPLSTLIDQLVGVTKFICKRGRAFNGGRQAGRPLGEGACPCDRDGRKGGRMRGPGGGAGAEDCLGRGGRLLIPFTAPPPEQTRPLKGCSQRGRPSPSIIAFLGSAASTALSLLCPQPNYYCCKSKRRR